MQAQPAEVNAKEVKWLRASEAAKHLKFKSPRSVLLLVEQGKIQSKRERDPESNQVVVLVHAGDVERIAYEREHPEMAVEKAEEKQTLPALRSLPAPALPASIRIEMPAPEVPPCAWLNADQAADYTGLPATFLIASIRAGKIRALDVGKRAGGRWRIKRSDLDAIEGEPLPVSN
jgi:excisionase family DNA binding protein